MTSAASGNREGTRLRRKFGSRSYSTAVQGIFFGELGDCHLAQNTMVYPAGQTGKAVCLSLVCLFLLSSRIVFPAACCRESSSF